VALAVLLFITLALLLQGGRCNAAGLWQLEVGRTACTASVAFVWAAQPPKHSPPHLILMFVLVVGIVLLVVLFIALVILLRNNDESKGRQDGTVCLCVWGARECEDSISAPDLMTCI